MSDTSQLTAALVRRQLQKLAAPRADVLSGDAWRRTLHRLIALHADDQRREGCFDPEVHSAFVELVSAHEYTAALALLELQRCEKKC